LLQKACVGQHVVFPTALAGLRPAPCSVAVPHVIQKISVKNTSFKANKQKTNCKLLQTPVGYFLTSRCSRLLSVSREWP